MDSDGMTKQKRLIGLPKIKLRKRSLLIFATFTLAALGSYFAAKSLLLAFNLERALPSGDQWVFVVLDYFGRIDGVPHSLFSQHNEHRIAMGRIILNLDAWLFNMCGWLPLSVQYLALAASACCLARLVADGRNCIIVATLTLLGLLWSTSEYENFSTAFQVVFPLVHFFALCAAAAFSLSLSDRANSMRWLALACIADILAISSLATGLIIIAPVICIAVWQRRIDRNLFIFAAVHAVLCLCYFIGYTTPSSSVYSGIPSFGGGMQIIFSFLGQSFTGRWELVFIAGEIGLAVVLFAGGWATWAAVIRKQEVDTRSAVLLSIAVFILAEAVVTAFARAHLGVAPRYSTAALFFQCSLLGFCWRQSALTVAPGTARAVIIVLTGIAVFGANSPDWEKRWIDTASVIDRATVEFGRGEFNKSTVDSIWSGLRKEWVDRYVALRLGPYGP